MLEDAEGLEVLVVGGGGGGVLYHCSCAVLLCFFVSSLLRFFVASLLLYVPKLYPPFGRVVCASTGGACGSEKRKGIGGVSSRGLLFHYY